MRTALILSSCFLTIILLSTFNSAKAQVVSVGPYAQQTIMGLQKGLEVNVTNANGLGIGIFHQSTKNLSFKEGYENYPFSGIEFQFPLVKNCSKVSLQAAIKTGFVNQNFFAITPEIISNLILNKWAHLVFGAGYRSGEAAVSVKLKFNLINQ